MNRRRPNPQALQAECARFNAKCPVGGAVTVKIEGRDAPVATVTTSEAEILGGHTAVVWLDNVRGCHLLSNVTPVGGAA